MTIYLHKIRAARREAEAIAAADMEPAAMRAAIAVLEKHLAELERDAEAAQTEARQRSIERAEALKRELNRAAEVAGEYIDAARALPDDIAGADFARRLLDDAIAGRPEAWDDCDIATAAHRAITHVRSCQWEAVGMGLALEALATTAEILPKSRRRPEIVRQIESLLGLYGRQPAALYREIVEMNEARVEERAATAQAIGADAIAAEKQRRLEAEARAGGYITLADVADIILKEIGPEVKNRESLKSSLSSFFKRHNLPSRPAEGHRQVREFDRQAAGAVVEAFCTRYYQGEMMPDADRQAVRDAMMAKAIERGKPKN